MARMLMLPLAATLFLASSAAAAAAPAVPTAAAPAAPVYAPVTIEENGEGCEQYTTESSGLSVELCQGSWIGEDGEEIVEDREGEPYRWIVGQVTNHNRAMGVCALAFDLGKAENAPGFVMDPTSLPLSSDKGKTRRGGKEGEKKRKKAGGWGELGPESLWTFSFLVPAEGGARVGLTQNTMVACEVEKRVEEAEEEEEEERRPVHDEEEDEAEEEETGGRGGGGGVEVDYVEKGGAEEEEEEEEGGVQDHDGGAVAYDDEMEKVAVSEEGREEGVMEETAHAHRKRERAARRQHRHPEGEGDEERSVSLASSAPASAAAAAAAGGEEEGVSVIHSGASSAWPGKMTSLVVCVALGVIAGMVA